MSSLTFCRYTTSIRFYQQVVHSDMLDYCTLYVKVMFMLGRINERHWEYLYDSATVNTTDQSFSLDDRVILVTKGLRAIYEVILCTKCQHYLSEIATTRSLVSNIRLNISSFIGYRHRDEPTFTTNCIENFLE